MLRRFCGFRFALMLLAAFGPLAGSPLALPAAVAAPVASPTTTSEAEAVVIQPDGKLVVAGRSNNALGHGESTFALARYNADGSPDPTFGGGGRVATPI